MTDPEVGSTARGVRPAYPPHFGFRYFKTPFPKSDDPNQVENRARMLSSEAIAAFETAVAWLSACRKTLRPNRGIGSSYTLKHRAENWGKASGLSPYVSNGMLIAAAIHLGFVWKLTDTNSPNVYVGVEKRSMPLNEDELRAEENRRLRRHLR